jgi:hypothetical protein
MPMINGHFYSIFGQYSARVSNMITRYRMAQANQQAESDAATVTGAMSDAMSQLSQGMSDLAAQQALARINAAVSAKQTNASSTDSGTADTSAADSADPVTAVNEVINGIDSLIGETSQQTDGSDVTSAINQIIDGAAPASSDTAGGADLFSQIDSMINSFVPPPVPAVDITV